MQCVVVVLFLMQYCSCNVVANMSHERDFDLVVQLRLLFNFFILY